MTRFSRRIAAQDSFTAAEARVSIAVQACRYASLLDVGSRDRGCLVGDIYRRALRRTWLAEASAAAVAAILSLLRNLCANSRAGSGFDSKNPCAS